MTSKGRQSALSLTSFSFPTNSDMLLFLYRTENCQGFGEGYSVCLRINISILEKQAAIPSPGSCPLLRPGPILLRPGGTHSLGQPALSSIPSHPSGGALPLLGQNLPTNPSCSHHNGRIREDRADRFRIRHPPWALARCLRHWQGVAWLELAVLTLPGASRFQKGHPPVKTIIFVPTSHGIVVRCGTKHG